MTKSVRKSADPGRRKGGARQGIRHLTLVSDYCATKFGGVLLLRMRQKAMQLVLICLNFSTVSEVTLGPFVGFLCNVLGHEIRWCFAVADARNDVVLCRCGCAIESHAARACLS